MKKKKQKNETLDKLWSFLEKHKLEITAFLIPVIILLILYIVRNIYPFGDRSYMRVDFYHQYAPFMKEFAHKLKTGGSLLFSWQNGMGINYWAQYAYYLASPINWLIALGPEQYIVEMMNATMALRSGLAGLCMFLFLSGKYEKKEWVTIGFAILYALSGFYFAYACNIIWMDCFALFPLAALGVDNIVKGKSGKLYGIAMGICTVSNFYMAVICGLCLVLYFFWAEITAKENSFKKFLKAGFTFLFVTIVYVAVAGVILLPVFLALQETPSGASEFPKEWRTNFIWYELLERFLVNAESITKGSDLPNAYSSVFILLALPLLCCNKSVPLREKIATVVLFVFMCFSFWGNIPDYIWHGFHFPNSFPARQSFFIIFLSIAVMYRFYMLRNECHKAAVGIVSGIQLMILIAGWIFLGKDNDGAGAEIYLVSILFILGYVLILVAEKENLTRVFSGMMLAMLILESVVNTFNTGLDSVVIRDKYRESDVAVAEMLEDIEAEEGDAFFRFEKWSRKTVNDSAWQHYNGISYFSSTVRRDVCDFYKQFGFRFSNGSYSFQGATPFAASLFGVKYMMDEKEWQPAANYTVAKYTTEHYKDGEKDFYLYTNPDALPLAFVVDSSLDERFEFPEKRNPFLVQNTFVNCVLENEEELFESLKTYKKETVLEEVEDGEGIEAVLDGEGSEENADVTANCVEVEPGDNLFLFVRNGVEKITVTTRNTETDEESVQKFDGLNFRQVVPLGITEYPREVAVRPDGEESSEVIMYACRMNQDVYEKVLGKLGEYPLEFHKIKDGKMEASLNSTGGTVFTTIPYDEGWQVTVDGENVNCYAWEKTFLAFDVTEGSHEVKFTYIPPGFQEGCTISLVGILVTILLLMRKKEKLEKQA